MPINFRSTVAVVADGSITSDKLANDAVIESKIANNAVTTNKIVNDAVIASKLATDSVSTVKIQDDAVTIDKAARKVSIGHFLGVETEVYTTGTTETAVGEFNFNSQTNDAEDWQSFSYTVSLKSDDIGNTATLRFYIDNVQHGADFTTNSTTFVFDSDNSVGLSLSPGAHNFQVRLLSSDVAGIATMGRLDVYLAKK